MWKFHRSRLIQNPRTGNMTRSLVKPIAQSTSARNKSNNASRHDPTHDSPNDGATPHARAKFASAKTNCPGDSSVSSHLDPVVNKKRRINAGVNISRMATFSSVLGEGNMIGLGIQELSVVDMMNCATDLELADPEDRILIDEFVDDF